MLGTNAPTVSVIIPAKDPKPEDLYQAISSALSQSVRTEVLVIDDGSNPPIRFFHPRVKIHRRSKSGGPAVSRNLGLKLASGKFVAFLDSDDWWSSNFLSSSTVYLNKNPQLVGTLALSHKIIELGFSFSGYIKILTFNLLRDCLVLISYFTNNKQLKRETPILSQISHMLFRKSKINAIKFDTSYKYCEDMKFVFQSQTSGQIGIIPRRLVWFRYSSGSNTFTQFRKNNDKPLYYHRLLSEIKNSCSPSLYLKTFEFYINHLLIK